MRQRGTGMIKIHFLVLGFGVGLGVIVNTALNPPEQVDYDKLKSIISISLKTEMENYRASVPLSQTVTPSSKVSFSDSEGKPQFQQEASTDLLLDELKRLFTDLSLELRSDMQHMSNSNIAQNNSATLSEPTTPPTPEQLAKQNFVIEQANGYLDEVINRGVWDATDVAHMRDLTATLPASKSIKIQQEILAAMNDGRINTDLGPMELF
jgi:hypothetical protein